MQIVAHKGAAQVLERKLAEQHLLRTLESAELAGATWLTLAAYAYAREAGVLGARYPGGVVRLVVAVVVLVAGGIVLLTAGVRFTRVVDEIADRTAIGEALAVQLRALDLGPVTVWHRELEKRR